MGLSREEISRKFLEYERDQDLLHLSINSVFVWQITRVWIFLKLLKFPHPPSKMEDNNFLLKTGAKGIRVIINSILFNPFFDFNRSNTLIFQSNRKYPINEHYIDIYTHYLVEELRSKGQSITIYETILENGPKKSNFARKERNTKHLDFLSLLSKVMKVFIRPKLSKVELNQIKSIEVAINEIFHIDLNLHVFFQDAIRKFKSELIVYDFLFKIKKSKEIFLVGSNDKQSLIVAAKRNNIIVNELQHGLNSDKDVILNYPYTVEESLEYFPNHFYKWNNVEMFFAKLPLKSDNIFEIPNYHLEFMIESTKTISRDAKSVLIISQPHGSKEILRFILNNISELDSYKIIYKIHPTEDFNKSIEDQFVDHKNIHFVRNEESIYALMKKCEFVVGIYSSSLYEAVVFNCSIILLKLPGVEMSLNLLKNSKCKLMDINDRLLKFMIDKI